MINKTLSQKGSAHAVIIVILVVALLGTLGFIFWQNFIKPETAQNTNSNTSKTENKEKTTDDTKKSNQLVLNDWGVKFTIAAPLASTEVKYKARDANSYVFTTSRIEALGGECTKSPYGDTASLIRFTEKPVAVPDGELINESPINGYYYALSGPIASCSGFDSNGQMTQPNPIETNDRDALKVTIKTLSAE